MGWEGTQKQGSQEGGDGSRPERRGLRPRTAEVEPGLVPVSSHSAACLLPRDAGLANPEVPNARTLTHSPYR